MKDAAMFVSPGLRVGRSTPAVAVALATLLAAAPAGAQVTLDGTYIDYTSVRSNGAFALATAPAVGQSMRYAESGAAPYSCDAFQPGMPVEEITVEATSGAVTRRFTNTGVGGAEIATASGPTIVGSTITWSGGVAADPFQFTVAKTYRLDDANRLVELDVTITNTGTTALANVYYLRSADPDHGQCDIGASYETVNDVLRQPPTNDSALVVAGTVTGTSPMVVLGVGAFDPRARAHVGTTLYNTNPTATWSAPRDPGGTRADAAIAVVFRETTLAAGASTTFRMAWVWGPNSATVTTRFDSLACVIGVEGTACRDGGGAAGTCHAGACCTGCWAGGACSPGTDVGACGTGGSACASCNDGNLCTSDACTAGACVRTPVPGLVCDDGWYCTTSDACDAGGTCTGTLRDCDDGIACTTDLCDEGTDTCANTLVAGFCAIGGVCVADGTIDPVSRCLMCVPSVSTTAWTPLLAGTPCDDGGFCTVVDACDGAGACAGTARDCADGIECTTDTCDDTLDVCASAIDTGFCLIDGACLPAGTPDPANACFECDPVVEQTDWTALAAGDQCGDPACAAGILTPAPTCDGIGACLAGTPAVCPSGVCADAFSCTGTCTNDLDCPVDQFCDTDLPDCVDDLLDGAFCDRDAQCANAHCADGVCCDAACDGTCEACDLDGSVGECSPYAAGTDPEGECSGMCNGAGGCTGGTDGGTDGDADGDADGGGDADADADARDVPTDGPVGDVDTDADGGIPETADGGCGCRAAGAGSGAGAGLLLLGLFGLAVLRRRR